MKTAILTLPRHLVLRDPRDGRTLRLSAYQDPAGRYLLSLDLGSSTDGASLTFGGDKSGCFATAADLQQRLIALLTSYRAAGYEITSERHDEPGAPASAPAWRH
jgi:hypothetical protein